MPVPILLWALGGLLAAGTVAAAVDDDEDEKERARDAARAERAARTAAEKRAEEEKKKIAETERAQRLARNRTQIVSIAKSGIQRELSQLITGDHCPNCTFDEVRRFAYSSYQSSTDSLSHDEFTQVKAYVDLGIAEKNDAPLKSLAAISALCLPAPKINHHLSSDLAKVELIQKEIQALKRLEELALLSEGEGS